MSPPPTAALALGSNLGDRFATLRHAVAKIDTFAPVVAKSTVYQTAPVGCSGPCLPFLNAVILVSFAGAPEELHALTKSVERSAGRPEIRTQNAPRSLDVDLLCFADEIRQSDSLTLPHPRLHQRRFVLQPFAEVWPELRLPGFNESVAALHAALASPEPPLRVFVRQW